MSVGAASASAAAQSGENNSWVPICKPEDLPKGEAAPGGPLPPHDQRIAHHAPATRTTHARRPRPPSPPRQTRPAPPLALPAGTRKEFDVDGTDVLVFWYRNQLYCIESRSPAEGAYSEGFIKAKFTQASAPGHGRR